MKAKRIHPKIKAGLHPKNKHRERYDFKKLTAVYPQLIDFVKINDFGDESIDFFNPAAVKALNTALLKYFYNITFWEIPQNYLCPPIPGRADYIHNVAQLLSESNFGKMPEGTKITCLDVGVGANCIYPIIGNYEYGWTFIGSDIDELAIENAKNIIKNNTSLSNKVSFRLQKKAKDVFYGVLTKEEQVDISICNPPFYASFRDAELASQRKFKNLKKGKKATVVKNFGGQSNELWCEGGENKFVRNMVRESKNFAQSCFWFTTLIAKQTNLKSVYKALEFEEAISVKTIAMGQGNKVSRIVAWTFLNAAQQKEWRENRWQL